MFTNVETIINTITVASTDCVAQTCRTQAIGAHAVGYALRLVVHTANAAQKSRRDTFFIRIQSFSYQVHSSRYGAKISQPSTSKSAARRVLC